MAALPLAKLGGLLIKTLSKPLAKSLKESAKSHPNLSTVLASAGEASHQAAARLSILSGGFRVKAVPKLEEKKALERGADMFGEGIVLTVASSVLVFEYVTNAAKTKEKEAKKMAELDAIDEDLQTRLLLLEKRYAALEKKLKGSWGGGVEKVSEEEVRGEVKEKNKEKKKKTVTEKTVTVVEKLPAGNPGRVRFSVVGFTALPPSAPPSSFLPPPPSQTLNRFGIDTKVYDMTDSSETVPDGAQVGARIQEALRRRRLGNTKTVEGERGRIDERESFSVPAAERGEGGGGGGEERRGEQGTRGRGEHAGFEMLGRKATAFVKGLVGAP